MRVVYIAGKVRDKTPWDVEQNVRRAEELALKVAWEGAMPLCPHTNSRFFLNQRDDAFWLEGTLEMMRRCDAVILVDNWRGSIGAIGEKKEAERLGIPVFETIRDLKAWLEAQEIGEEVHGECPALGPVE